MTENELKARIEAMQRKRLNEEHILLLHERERHEKKARDHKAKITRLEEIARERNQQITTLQSEAIEREALVERLKTFLHDMPCAMENCGGIYSNYMCTTCAFLADLDTPEELNYLGVE